MQEFFLTGRLDMRPFFDRLPWLAVLLAPAASMRLFAEERKHRTIELWRTLPLTPGQVVLGKLAGALAAWTLFLAGTLAIPAMLVTLGEPDLGLVAAGYLGALLLGAFLLALGELCSALARNQVSAFVAAALGSFALVAAGDERVTLVLDGAAPGLGSFLADRLSVLPRYEALVSGLVGLADLVWILGLTGVLVGLTTFVVGRLRD
jgi:ABC-2 type transport system permease protein